MTTSTVALASPSLERLDQYADALRQGWSPNTVKDVSREQLARLEADPEAFVRGSADAGGPLRWRVFWIVDDAGFAGLINFRFQPGTDVLPEGVSGHVGFSVVPWKRRRGYATKALALILPIAAAEGLPRIVATCDADNFGSIRAITANGATLVGKKPSPFRAGGEICVYTLSTAKP